MWVYEFFHVIVGILWIGLLYFFNLVQVQSMPKMVDAGGKTLYADHSAKSFIPFPPCRIVDGYHRNSLLHGWPSCCTGNSQW